ncbi:hypothetical protein [Desulfosporosinus youngiae]|uniref:Uncharacterized protein n=1 Tax=Desulfosporosinus youngiae DSM 17734 TaxID=768710 RepID=H5XVI1_9FIRM|nr:hypothetical protein [Desulfosporosinus youngiae]EHQ90064.1 hypothetical protein DesyoDRAFT_3019 [Desulfosporosinus youngiae DSM 17734]
MKKTISAFVNVALDDYDDSMLNHVVELMKETLREQYFEKIFEDTWRVEENRRCLVKDKEGAWVTQSSERIIESKEILEVMTVGITVDVEDAI